MKALKSTRFFREEHVGGSPLAAEWLLSQLNRLSKSLKQGPNDSRKDEVTEDRLKGVLRHVEEKTGTPKYAIVSQWLASVEHCGDPKQLAKWYARSRGTGETDTPKHA